jgi:hypothetical protein
MPNLRRIPFQRPDRKMALWLPALLVIIVTSLSLTALGPRPAAPSGRRSWMTAILIFGSLAIATSVWLGRRAADEALALAGTSAAPQGATAGANVPSVASLTFRIKVLEDRVKELEAGRQARSIPQKTADDLTSYLKPFGSRRVIVSCIPDDTEAYLFANQLVNILKAADWDARGPQTTKIFGDVRSPGLNVYVNGDNSSDTVKVLLAGFAKFNIPYQPRITPTVAIPDTETVELFIGTNQSQRANAGAD